MQLHNVAISSLLSTPLSSKEALGTFLKSELKQAEADYGQAVKATEEAMKTKEGLEAMYWHFEVPVKKGKENVVRRVLEEHFIAVACDNDILLISSALTNNNRPDEIPALLKKVANTIKVADGPIDLNAIRDAATSR